MVGDKVRVRLKAQKMAKQMEMVKVLRRVADDIEWATNDGLTIDRPGLALYLSAIRRILSR